MSKNEEIKKETGQTLSKGLLSHFLQLKWRMLCAQAEAHHAHILVLVHSFNLILIVCHTQAQMLGIKW